MVKQSGLRDLWFLWWSICIAVSSGYSSMSKWPGPITVHKSVIFLYVTLLFCYFDPEEISSKILWNVSNLYHFNAVPCSEDCTVKLDFVNYLRFEVPMAVKMLMVAFWAVTPCRLVASYELFRGMLINHLQDHMASRVMNFVFLPL
jgi:hypothetical protein